MLLVPFVSNQVQVVIILYTFVLIVNRYTVLVIIFLLIGSVSGRIYGLICTNSTGAPSLLADTSSPVSQFEMDPDAYDRLNALVLIFTALFSGYLYNDSASSRYPILGPYLLLVFACSTVLGLFYYAKLQTKGNLAKKYIGSRGGSSASSNNVANVKKPKTFTPNSSSLKMETVELPPRSFIELFKGDVNKACTAYNKTLEWRNHNCVDDIFRYPQDVFYEILDLYPHALHGVAFDGSHVVYELLGQAKPKQLVEAGIGPDKLVWHFVLRNEYIFHRFHKERAHALFDPRVESCVSKDELNKLYINEEPQVKIMTILDVAGIRVSDINSDVISFIKQSSDIIDAHYPGRVTRLVVVNAPTWFWSVWSMISRVLSESVRKKIVILNDTKGLDNIVPPDQRPKAYGGTDVDLGKSVEHLEFISIAESWKDFEETIMDGIPSNSTHSTKSELDISTTSKKTTASSSSFSNWISAPFQTEPEAHLGDENKFRYDPESSTWCLESQDEEESALISLGTTEEDARKGELTKEELEEHMMVLAIQAAHVAAKGAAGKGGKFDLKGFKDGNLIRSDNIVNMYGDTNSTMDSDIASSNERNQTKTSAHMFLLVTGAHFFTCISHSGLLCMLPVWFMTSEIKGGLGYTTFECGMCISAVALMLFHINIFFRQRLAFVLKTSPLRAMRIGAGAVMVSCILLPHLSHHDWQSTSSKSLEIRSHSISFAPLSALLPVILCAVIVCFARFCRNTSTVIFQIALDPSFKSPSTILTAITNLADVLGPVIFSSIFTSCYRTNHRYPFDTSFFLTVVACTALLLYIGTLMLNLSHRGDFGVITDVTIQAKRGRISESGFSCMDWLRLFALTYATLLYDDITLLLIPSSPRFHHLNFKEG